MISNDHERHLASHMLELLRFKLGVSFALSKEKIRQIKREMRRIEKEIAEYEKVLNSPLYKALNEVIIR